MSQHIDTFLRSHGCSPVSPLSFYRDLFPLGCLEACSDRLTGKYVGIIVEVYQGMSTDGQQHRHHRTHLCYDDLDAVNAAIASGHACYMSPVSYAGRRRTGDMARELYALTFDVDYVWQRKDKGLDALIWQFDHHYLPSPTYIVSSGTGIHLYYMLEKPVMLFREAKDQINKLRHELTTMMWVQGVVDPEQSNGRVQYEPVTQAFRMPGTLTKNGKTIAKAYRYDAGEKVTIEWMNKYVYDKSKRADLAIVHERATTPLEEAKEKWPDWYQRRIVDGLPPGNWTDKRDLYEWWKRKILAADGATEGHRYWCLVMLTAYARKCGVPKEDLQNDADTIRPILSARGQTVFSDDDVYDALSQYNNDDLIRYTIDHISELSDIRIVKNKRNSRDQQQHLIYARGVRKLKKELGENVSGGGRPNKQVVVQDWRKNHPNGTKSECARDTGLSRPTIIKWWDATGK